MKTFVLGVAVNAITRSQALDRVRQLLADGSQHVVITPNPEIVMAARRDLRLRAIINSASLAAPDGVGLVWALRRRGVEAERVPGVEVMTDICELAAALKKCVFLLGGKRGAAERTATRLRKQWPALSVAGWSENADDIETIRRTRPDILFVALGTPKQEYWIETHLTELPSVKIALGVGGAFDILSGQLPRAPGWLRRLGLEWCWRLMLEPSRLARIFNAVVRFPLAIWRA
ncbi:WecB/TagA/CpsF family glycosyltransferase [Candidatus Parcubacteria bacterium]|uniref:WecB/TagA/CpsF family glycosyltransferase n=1 Tax=Candidatus Sungiibacteriota bacterium TaxID=2750080 RepID=A0A932YVZ4_9BACT|nr:WecB/TagA/CpsF family glycosyltransferase [Candidatus Sungbacteria bacterium]MBI4385721.1 WecB/TagA/CpsF family glycosyltransferase [Candidatus Parcubacteria bacterium]